VKNANPEPSDHGHPTGIGNLPNVGFAPQMLALPPRTVDPEGQFTTDPKDITRHCARLRD
jgi:hypothetical protein